MPRAFYAEIVHLIALLALLGSTPLVLQAATTPANLLRANSVFAAADFDGDNRADTATLQPGTTSAGRGEYFVRLWLSSSGRRYIRVAAPEGSLSVAAIDVNGDHAIDLVFVTRWLGQPVAILLNDGHGHFSPADPARFHWSRQKTTFLTHAHGLMPFEFAERGPESSAVGANAEAGTPVLVKRARSPRFATGPWMFGFTITRLSPRAPPSAIP